MDKAFITGATGFVGANLARVLLKKGCEVRVLARKNSNRKNLDGLPVQIIEGDLSDRDALRSGCREARYVFHVAADYRLWVRQSDEMFAANVQGTSNILQTAGKAGAEKIVFCSSVATIKPPADPGKPSDESSKYSTVDEIVSPYKKSKWLAEQAAMDLARIGLPIVVVNPSAPIGPMDIKPTPTGKMVLDFLNGRIPSYIDTGLNVAHVRDIAEGHWQAALKGRIGERYILGGRNMTLKEILDTLAEVTGLPSPRFRVPYAVAFAFAALDTGAAWLLKREPFAPLDAVRMARHHLFYDCSKAMRELDYRPLPAKTALRDAVRWFLENGYIQDEKRRAHIAARLSPTGRITEGTNAQVPVA